MFEFQNARRHKVLVSEAITAGLKGTLKIKLTKGHFAPISSIRFLPLYHFSNNIIMLATSI